MSVDELTIVSSDLVIVVCVGDRVAVRGRWRRVRINSG